METKHNTKNKIQALFPVQPSIYWVPKMTYMIVMINLSFVSISVDCSVKQNINRLNSQLHGLTSILTSMKWTENIFELFFHTRYCMSTYTNRFVNGEKNPCRQSACMWQVLPRFSGLRMHFAHLYLEVKFALDEFHYLPPWKVLRRKDMERVKDTFCFEEDIQ